MENPIKENRIVKDKTFALRLLGFALDTNCADACSEDEKESMISYATSLLKYQIKTATDKEEIDQIKGKLSHNIQPTSDSDENSW